MRSTLKLTLGLLAGTVCTWAFVSSSAHAAILTDTTPSTESGKWILASDTAVPVTRTVSPSTGAVSYLSRGLYSVNTPSPLSFTWTGTAGIQTILNHTLVLNATSGMGSLFTTTVNPASVDGKNLGIAAIDLTIRVRQTGTTLEKGQIAGFLVQGGKYYRTSFNIFAGTTTTPTLLNTINLTGLTPSSFGEFAAGVDTSDGAANFASNPDFSPTGGTIQLGYLTGYDPSLYLGTGTSNLNRSVVTSWTATITAVPEPTAALAALVALPLLSRVRRAR